MSGLDPLVSIITPSFQQARYLRACIESVVGQRYPKIEYLVLDGGSTDGSAEILRTFGKQIVWQSQPDDGQPAAVNEGLRRAQGEVLAFLNSDDLLLPGAVGRVVDFLNQNPEVDVVYGKADIIDSDGRILRPAPTLPFDYANLIEHCFICQPATFWRRRVHDRFGWFDASFDNTFDYEFWLRIAKGGARFAYLPEILAQSREHSATKSQRQRGRIFAEIRRMQFRHLGYCGRNWWEQQLRYWRDESSSPWGRMMPGRRDQRLYRLAWWPYVLWRRRLGGPLFYRPGHWRA